MREPVEINDGARAYAIDECKRAYGPKAKSTSTEVVGPVKQLHNVACWVFAGMQRLLPPWELMFRGKEPDGNQDG